MSDFPKVGGALPSLQQEELEMAPEMEAAPEMEVAPEPVEKPKAKKADAKFDAQGRRILRKIKIQP